jgi:hypothetical protein
MPDRHGKPFTIGAAMSDLMALGLSPAAAHGLAERLGELASELEHGGTRSAHLEEPPHLYRGEVFSRSDGVWFRLKRERGEGGPVGPPEGEQFPTPN